MPCSLLFEGSWPYQPQSWFVVDKDESIFDIRNFGDEFGRELFELIGRRVIFFLVGDQGIIHLYGLLENGYFFFIIRTNGFVLF